MTAVDDLHVNNWIAVTTWAPECGISLFGTPIERSRPVDGQPLQIRAISLPFICVSDGFKRWSLDMRTCEVRKLHPKYVKMMKKQSTNRQGGGYQTRDGIPVVSLDEWAGNAVPDDTPTNKSRAEPFKRACPICGGPLVERLVAEDRTWVLFCNECQFRGNIPRDGEGTES